MNRRKVVRDIYREYLQLQQELWDKRYRIYDIYTYWVNYEGNVKLRITKNMPKVQYFNNPQHFNKNRDTYKDVEIGDIDAYGWICFDIEKHEVFIERTKMEVIRLDKDLPGREEYRKLYHKYLNQIVKKVPK